MHYAANTLFAGSGIVFNKVGRTCRYTTVLETENKKIINDKMTLTVLNNRKILKKNP